MQLEVHSVLLPLQASVPGMAVIAFLSSLCWSECFAGVLTAAQVHGGANLWDSFFCQGSFCCIGLSGV